MATKPTNFYEVIVSNIGKVHESNSLAVANSIFKEYCALSHRPTGRASGESVSLWKNNKPIKELTGDQNDDGEFRSVVSEPAPDCFNVRVTQDRDDLASWVISLWQDAEAFSYTHEILMEKQARVWQDKRYKRLTRIDKAYIDGFSRSYQLYVIDRMFLEHGSWVRMPDGSEKWFGIAERLTGMGKEITHRYIHENAILGRSGIYWQSSLSRGRTGGSHPFFLPSAEKSEEISK